MEDFVIPSEDAAGVLRCYNALENASHEMLRAAREGDWDSVCRLEGACAVVIVKLRQMTHRQPLSATQQKERMRILRAIVANDAMIRRICDPLPAMLDPQSFVVSEVSTALH